MKYIEREKIKKTYREATHGHKYKHNDTQTQTQTHKHRQPGKHREIKKIND